MPPLGERRQHLARPPAAGATSRRRPAGSARGRAARPRRRAPAPTASSRRLSSPWPTMRAHPLRRKRGARPGRSIAYAERVADRGVAVDERAVEIEDDERPAAQADFRDPLAESRFWRSSPARVQHGRDDRVPVAEGQRRDRALERARRRSARPARSPRAARCPVRTTSIFGIGQRLVPLDENEVAVRELARAGPRRTASSSPNRRAVVRPGVTSAPTAAPAAACRCESLPADVVVHVARRVLDRADDAGPCAFSRGTSSTRIDGLAGVVAADERDDRGPAVGIEQVRLAARPELPRPRRSGARSRRAGPRPPRPSRGSAAIRSAGRSPAGRRTRRARCASETRAAPALRAVSMMRRPVWNGRNAARSVDVDARAAALLAGVLVEHRPELRREGRERPAAPSAFSASVSATLSSHGAPKISNGRVVPRPSERFVPSSRHMPG